HVMQRRAGSPVRVHEARSIRTTLVSAFARCRRSAATVSGSRDTTRRSACVFWLPVSQPRTQKEMAWWRVDQAQAFLNSTVDDRLSALWTLLLPPAPHHWVCAVAKRSREFAAPRLHGRVAFGTQGRWRRHGSPRFVTRRDAAQAGQLATLRDGRAQW